MKRTLLVLLLGVVCALVAAMMVVAGAYSGLARATEWQRQIEAAVFVICVAGWLILAATTWIAALRSRRATVLTGFVAIAAASGLWLALLET